MAFEVKLRLPFAFAASTFCRGQDAANLIHAFNQPRGASCGGSVVSRQGTNAP